MEISIILENKLVCNYNFTNKHFFKKVTLDDKIDNEYKLNKREIKVLDKWIGSTKKNRKLYRALVFLVAFSSYGRVVFASVEDACSRLDMIGFSMLAVFKKAGFWICILSCFIDIMKSFLNSEGKDVWKIFFKYVSIFLAMNALQPLFELIKGMLGG